MTIAANLANITERITLAAAKGGRNPEAVRLVAVSKTRPTEDIAAAFECGQIVFGENYVQEFTEKFPKVTDQIQWHFIGHLQSNKVKYIAGKVALIHSVDRLSLAEEIDRQWRKLDKTCDVLIQVNISGETSKSGTTEAGAIELVRTCAKLPNIRIKGLMTMPPFFDDPDAARPYFTELRHLSENIAAQRISGVEMTELSMGMSGDFVTAIEEGATLVRVGTAIFGER